MIRLRYVGTAIAIGTLLIACSDGDKTASNAASSERAASSPDERETVAKISAEATKCLAMVKSARYVEAVEVCQAALKDGANVDVQIAYDQALAAVKQEAQAAAVSAAADTLSGKAPEDAAKDALGRFGAGLAKPKP